MDAEEQAFLGSVIHDAQAPVVIFALEWCEFCWSVRKFFAKVGIAYRAIDLDSVEYQAGNCGRKIRDVLAARTQMKTIPQLFIGGEFVGGCTDVFDGWKAGRIQLLLNSYGVAFDTTATADPYSFLPEWLLPR